MSTSQTPVRLPARNVEVVLGAAGVKGPAHIGLLRCLEERRVSIGRLTGASAGSLIATFKANGYDSHEMERIFTSEGFRYPDWNIWAQCLHLYDPWNWWKRMLEGGLPGMLDFGPWLSHLVDEYELKPQDNLRIVATDLLTRQPIIFEGRGINLKRALKASTGVISVGMEPAWLPAGEPHSHKGGAACDNPLGHYAADGFYYHPEPADLCDSPAIVSKVGFATRWPSERLSPGDLLMHVREMMEAPLLSALYPDHPGHLTVNVGLPDVASLTFGLSQHKIDQLVHNGYCQACRALSDHHAEEWLHAKNCVCHDED